MKENGFGGVMISLQFDNLIIMANGNCTLKVMQRIIKVKKSHEKYFPFSVHFQ